MSAANALILACSPRAGGNSDTAAQALARGFRAAGRTPEILFLREYEISPCTGCGGCSVGGRCAFDGTDRHDQDDVSALFARIFAANVVAFASPIYFYHLPAHFKAFIDRSQVHYTRKRLGDPAAVNRPRKQAAAVLVAARTEGEKLFDGSLLTLTYFLEPLNMDLTSPLTLRGLDRPGDLTAEQETQAEIAAYAREAATWNA